MPKKKPPSLLDTELKELIDRIFKTNEISSQDHFDLVTRFLANQLSDEGQRTQVETLLDKLQTGKIKLTHE